MRLGNLFWEIVKREYKREFVLWLLSLICFSGVLFGLIRESRIYQAQRESLTNLEGSLQRLQPHIIKVKDSLSKVNWEQEFSKQIIEVRYSVDLRNLSTALRELGALTNLEGGTFFVLKEMTFHSSRETSPSLNLVGELVTFY